MTRAVRSATTAGRAAASPCRATSTYSVDNYENIISLAKVSPVSQLDLQVVRTDVQADVRRSRYNNLVYRVELAGLLGDQDSKTLKGERT